MSAYAYDLVVIGAGSAGMVAGEVAAKMGVRCALVERSRIGGDCLWTGCIPSKALIASAKAAHLMRHAAEFGLPPTSPAIDTAAVWDRIRRIQREIAQTDDHPQKFAEAGVDVIPGDARLVDGHHAQVGDRRISTRFILLAPGSRPVAPPIDGLEDAGYLTSESLFEQERAPRSLLIIGGGPVAVEMAQAHQRLGVRVTMLEVLDRILAREEPALADELSVLLQDDGIDVLVNVRLTKAAAGSEGRTLRGTVAGVDRVWTAEQILVAAGRKPNIEGLGLEQAGVKVGPHGVIVDGALRTSVPSVYACGDVAGRYLFTHSAGAEAAVALRNMFFPGTKRAPALIPWATFTEPELAHVGMTSEEARAQLGQRNVRVFRWRLAHNDRARAEGSAEGEIVVVTDSKFRILGAHILAPGAGDMIGEFVLAMDKGLRLTPDIANLVHVYPTYATSISQVAAEATYGQLGRPFLRTLRRLYARLG